MWRVASTREQRTREPEKKKGTGVAVACSVQGRRNRKTVPTHQSRDVESCYIYHYSVTSERGARGRRTRSMGHAQELDRSVFCHRQSCRAPAIGKPNMIGIRNRGPAHQTIERVQISVITFKKFSMHEVNDFQGLKRLTGAIVKRK